MSEVQIEGSATVWRPTMSLRFSNGVLQQLFLGVTLGPIGVPKHLKEWRKVPEVTE